MRRWPAVLITVAAVFTSLAGPACGGGVHISPDAQKSQRVDTIVMPWGETRYDTISAPECGLLPALPGDTLWRNQMVHMAEVDGDTRYTSLTDADYCKIAEELNVEVAAIKAVVRIEAGAGLEGFFAPGVPVINFDRKMYNKARPGSNVKAPASETVPEGIKSAYGRREWAQLVAARKVNRDKANMGTFWGMFQIGGFNYRQCGCSSVQEMVDRMSYSEFEQLQLFANFITNTGMLEDLRAKNWSAFARKYNGTSYRSRGYHTRMAKEYAKFKAQEKQ